METADPVVALTFDDGPDPEWTPRLLEILEQHDARGTFFMIGEQATKYPELVARVASGGHAIGNHSWDHASFPLLSREQRFGQLRRCSETLGRHAGRMFRPPYGHQDNRSRFDLTLAGYDVVTWSVIEPDWLDRDAEGIVAGIAKKIRPGAIVLLHDTLHDALQPEYFNREATLNAVQLLLERMRSSLQFVTVPELLRYGPARTIVWNQPPDIEFLKQLKNKAGIVRTY